MVEAAAVQRGAGGCYVVEVEPGEVLPGECVEHLFVGGVAAQAGNARAAAVTAASASASLDDENSPTVSLGRIGFAFV